MIRERPGLVSCAFLNSRIVTIRDDRFSKRVQDIPRLSFCAILSCVHDHAMPHRTCHLACQHCWLIGLTSRVVLAPLNTRIRHRNTSRTASLHRSSIGCLGSGCHSLRTASCFLLSATSVGTCAWTELLYTSQVAPSTSPKCGEICRRALSPFLVLSAETGPVPSLAGRLPASLSLCLAASLPPACLPACVPAYLRLGSNVMKAIAAVTVAVF